MEEKHQKGDLVFTKRGAIIGLMSYVVLILIVSFALLK